MSNEFTKYYKLIKILSKKVIIRIPIQNKIFEKALTYFNINLQYLDILNASINFSLLIFTLFLFLTIILNYVTLHLLTINFILTLSVFLYLYYYVPIRYFSLLKNFSLYSSTLLGIIYSVTTIGKPITLAFEILADSKIPRISNDFKEMLNKACLGKSATEMLLEYSRVQPSSTFRENIKVALTQSYKRQSIEKIWEYSIWEVNRVMLMETSKIEVMSILIIGGSAFTPFLIYLFIIFSLLNTPEVITIVTLTFLTLIIFIGYKLIKYREKITSYN
ncbi:MAG: hypothetical protein QXY40_05715 [Candidatus Methanomethylicia archaeon]